MKMTQPNFLIFVELSRALESDISKFLHRAPPGCKVSATLRQKVLLKLVKSLRQVDSSSSLSRAAEVEADLLVRSRGGTVSSVYLSAVSEYIKRLDEGGHKTQMVQTDAFEFEYDKLREIVAGKESLSEYSYPLQVSDPQEPGDTLVQVFNSVKVCRRCGKPFTPSKYYKDTAASEAACRYHHGKIEKIGGLRVYGCCQAPINDANGCCTHDWHVFEGYKRGEPLPRYHRLNYNLSSSEKSAVVALDAEMSYTVGGYEVSRVTLVDFFTESTLLDLLVLPRCPPVLDYNTKWSGVSAESFNRGDLEVVSFEAMRERIAQIVGEETILIGHSLDNDLLVLEVN